MVEVAMVSLSTLTTIGTPMVSSKVRVKHNIRHDSSGNININQKLLNLMLQI